MPRTIYFSEEHEDSEMAEIIAELINESKRSGVASENGGGYSYSLEENGGEYSQDNSD